MAPTDSDPPDAGSKSLNLPPAPKTLDDLPGPVSVPRLEPPPSSLGAMVQSRATAPATAQREANPWLILLFLLVAGVAATIYLYR